MSSLLNRLLNEGFRGTGKDNFERPEPTSYPPAAPKYQLPPGSKIASDVYRGEGLIQITGAPVWSSDEQAWKYPALTQGGRSFAVAERFITKVQSKPQTLLTP